MKVEVELHPDVNVEDPEHPEPTAEEIAEARALVMSKDFGRFKYRGKSGKVEHVWSTGRNMISGARIALNKDGSIHHISGPVLPVSRDSAPAEAEITEARAKIGIEEAQVQQSEWDFGRFKYQGLFDSIHRWYAGDVSNPVAQIWLDTNDGKGVCITDGEDKPATEEEIASAEALVKGSSSDQQSDWDFGRFKYRGKFEIPNSHMPIESRHTWYTEQGSKIGLREDGSLAFTCETHGLEKPTAFEIAKAQALVKHELAGDVPGSLLIKSFGRFIYFGKFMHIVHKPGDPRNEVEPNHLWATSDPPVLADARIALKEDGSLISEWPVECPKPATPEEIDTARNMVLSANLVKQVEEGERPVIRSTAFYRNKEKTEDPPFNQLSRGLGTAVFHQLMNVLKPKESKPVERFQIDPGPVYRIKPHVLSLPLLDPSTHTRHHCLYTERSDVFKISGLAMWGISEDTTLNISIGGRVIFDGDVPAQMFANGLSFHALYQILELKEPPDRIVSQDVPEDLLKKLRLNVKWRELEAGLIPPLKIHQSLELNISGPAKYAVFWGYRREIING